jgi:hypothetical protein
MIPEGMSGMRKAAASGSPLLIHYLIYDEHVRCRQSRVYIHGELDHKGMRITETLLTFASQKTRQVSSASLCTFAC